MDKIKIYTDVDKARSTSKWSFVFPLVEYLIKGNSQILDNYEKVNAPDKADFLALPLSVEYLFEQNQKKYYYDFLQLAKSHNKKLLVFTGGDYGKTINDDSVITIRLGGFKSKFPKHTFIMSPFIDDPFLKYNFDFYPLEYVHDPSIGFVGHSAQGIVKWSKEFLVFLKNNFEKIIGKKNTDMQSFYPSSIKRYQYLTKLESNKQLITDFIFRNRYGGGRNSDTERLKTTLEFYKNIQDNAYTFCLRGAGNFSVRFYETLAMGRIPLLLDTDCRLPFENEIDWAKHALIIHNTDIDSIVKSIIDFHEKLDEMLFKELQMENRKLWENYFTKDGYFINLKQDLKNFI